MNILLINPSQDKNSLEELFTLQAQLPPLGLLYIATPLEQQGHTVQLIDYCMESYSMNHLQRMLKNIDAVGISVRSQSRRCVKQIINDIKKYDESIPMIIGGPHCTLDPYHALKDLDADVCVKGDAEHVITRIIENIQGKESLDEIPGIFYKKNNEIMMGKPVTIITDIDQFSFPARYLTEKYHYGQLQAGLFIMSKGKVTSMITSRGCPYHCRFCINKAITKTVRFRSAENVINEIKDIEKQYDFLYIMDDNFFVNKEQACSILDYFIKEKPDLEFSIAGVRIDAIDQQLYKKLKQSGVKVIAYGIESGSQHVLDYYQKQISLSQISSSLHLARKNRLITVGYFMLGAPVETQKDIQDTIRFAKTLPLDLVVFQPLDYLKGSRMWDEAVKKGSISSDEFMVHSCKERNLSQFTRQELVDWTIQAYKEFYLRPRYFIDETVLSFIRGDFRILKNGLRNIMKQNSVLKT